MDGDRLRPLLETLAGRRSKNLLRFHDDYQHSILIARGSSHNHQAWPGGYMDHLCQCFTLAQEMYDTLSRLSPLPFSLESAIIVLYLHDIEKIFKYGVQPVHPLWVEHKWAWYLGIFPHKYKVALKEDELNALKYIHGEGDEYSGKERKMGALAAFCHSVDVISARIYWDKKQLCAGQDTTTVSSAKKNTSTLTRVNGSGGAKQPSSSRTGSTGPGSSSSPN